MAVSHWENGDNQPSGAHYAKMGNMAQATNTRLYFWQRAGIDIDVLNSAAVPSSGRPARKSPGKKSQET